jgi:hypothetical protein
MSERMRKQFFATRREEIIVYRHEGTEKLGFSAFSSDFSLFCSLSVSFCLRQHKKSPETMKHNSCLSVWIHPLLSFDYPPPRTVKRSGRLFDNKLKGDQKANGEPAVIKKVFFILSRRLCDDIISYWKLEVRR